jgi:hypothetical protein
MELSYVIGSLIVALFLLWLEPDYGPVDPPACHQSEECPQPEEEGHE